MKRFILSFSMILIAVIGYASVNEYTPEDIEYIKRLNTTSVLDSQLIQSPIYRIIDISRMSVLTRLSSMIDAMNAERNKGNTSSDTVMTGFMERAQRGLAMAKQSAFKDSQRELKRLMDDIYDYKDAFTATSDKTNDNDADAVKMIETCRVLINIADMVAIFNDLAMCQQLNQIAKENDDPISALIAYQYLERLIGDFSFFVNGQVLTNNAIFNYIDTANDEVHDLCEYFNGWCNWTYLTQCWIPDFSVDDIDMTVVNNVQYVKNNWQQLQQIDEYPNSRIGDYGYLHICLHCGTAYATVRDNNTAYLEFVEAHDYIDKCLPDSNKQYNILYERSLFDVIYYSRVIGDFETAKKYLEKILDYLECIGRRYLTHDDIFHSDNPIDSLYRCLINEEYLYFLIQYYEYALCYDSKYADSNKDFRMPILNNPDDINLYPLYTTDFASCKSYREMDGEMMKEYILYNALDFIDYICSLIPKARYSNDESGKCESYYLEWKQLNTYFEILRELYFDEKGLNVHIPENSPDHINALGLINYENDVFTNVLNNQCAPSHFYLGVSKYFEGKYQEAETYLSNHYMYDNLIYNRTQTAMMITRCVKHTGNLELAQQLGIHYSGMIREELYGVAALSAHNYADIKWSWGEDVCRQLNNFLLESPRPNLYAADVYNNILTFKGYLTQYRNSLERKVLQSGNDELKEQYAVLRGIEKEYSEAGISPSTVLINQARAQLMSAIEKSGFTDLIYRSDWTGIRSALADNECAIEFYQPDPDSMNAYALVIRDQYEFPHIIKLDLGDIDSQTRDGLMSLYDMIWHPLQHELKEVTNVYFSLDRYMDSLPVEYAIDRDGTMAGDKYRCLRLSSTKVLDGNRPSITNSRSAVLYGGLDFDQTTALASDGSTMRDGKRGSTDPLWGSLDEVNVLYDLLVDNGYNCTKYTGADGTERTLAALDGSELAILHFATHGLLFDDETLAEQYDDVKGVKLFDRLRGSKDDNEDLWRSGLAMSGCNKTLTGVSAIDADIDDGILTAAEISQLDLMGLDMVVLSSCHSGYYGGADGYGLQRGFKMAGANSLLLTLWDVDDEATQIFMSEFYNGYLSGKDKYDALRHAQQCLRGIDGYSDPYYWAGFILVDGI